MSNKVLTYSRISKTDKLIEFTYSESDKDTVESHKWHINKCGYVVRTQQKNNKHTCLYLHRVLMSPPSTKIVDHIDGNPLNNTRENMRVCFKQQNSMNQKKRCTNRSGFVGVCWDKRSSRWEASLTYKYKKKFLGYYNDKQDAIKARKEAEEKYFGEFNRK